MSLPPPLPPPSVLRPGVMLEGGRYTLLHPLGAGGNGVVCLARQESLSTDVVVKFPKRWRGASAAEAELFINEMRRLASLSNLHPHVVNILDAGAYRGRPFFVMQYLSRGALDGYCGPTQTRPGAPPLPPVDANWIESIAGALDFLHERATIHRDVKPGNILLDESHGSYLADFGIAMPNALTPQSPPAELHRRDAVTGSLPYLAPELLVGGSASAASDQFALAVTIFEFLTRRRPFDGDTSEQVLESYRQRMTTWLTAAPPSLSAPLWRAISRALSEHPTHRYSSCTNLARATAHAVRITMPPTSRFPLPMPALPTVSTTSTSSGSTQVQAIGSTASTPPEKPADCPQARPLSLDRLLQSRRIEKDKN